MLAAGVGAAVFLVNNGQHAKNWADRASQATAPTITMVEAIQQERQLTLSALSDGEHHVNDLRIARQRVDSTLQSMAAVGDALAELAPDAFNDRMATSKALLSQIPAVRSRADAAQLPAAEAYDFYNQAVDVVTAGSLVAAKAAPDAATAVALTSAITLFRAQEAMSRSAALAVTAFNGIGWAGDNLIEYSRQVGLYRSTIAEIAPELNEGLQDQLRVLTSNTAWRDSNTVADAIIQRGLPSPSDKPVAPPINFAAWQGAAATVSTALLDLWRAQSVQAQQSATDAGERTATNSIIGGGVALLVAIAAFAAAVALANRFIARLVQLRRDTLELADEQLPDIIRRIHDGTPVDLDTEMAHIDHADDEIGHVAAAFSRAEQVAVSAAVAEAKTREGVNSVFLNIAHRSQLVAHRQLEILDRAERALEDPVHLQTLFQLDHLATRARRNAENLIILGGEQPGRQWRNPVPLSEVVRGAMAETLEYTRIHTAHLADVHIVGTVIADLIHLLAELMDNATAFSPPEARVEVRATVVGRGVAIEISDQGLGMTDAELAERNDMLRDAPDFSVATLSSDSRLGLFVVAKLAARNSISVRLSESDYGGVRAIVLIPTDLVTPVSASRTSPPLSSEPHDSPRSTAEPYSTFEPDRSGPRHYVRPAGIVEPEPLSDAATILPDPSPPPSTAATPAAPAGWFSDLTDTEAPDSRPPLPRRRRQSSLAPQLAHEPTHSGQHQLPNTPRPERSAEQARDLFSAIEAGTKQGRHASPDNDSTAFNEYRARSEGEDG
ncbi:sensor histidine kinase [Nocardia sp. CA-135398]|uniref:sensor histidine kinase n=1 Tax=Nocardia sp. CA-135398 TaxID=3239977 RepID=UPI003D960F6B